MKKIFYAFLSLSILSCNTDNDSASTPDEAISENGLVGHIKTLASDEFQGRKPFSEGETKTVNYLNVTNEIKLKD